MTKEEAIQILDNGRYFVPVESWHYEYNEALDMAIEALSDEAVKGEWKIDEYGIYHCPFCHAINNTVYKSFCPNCGARMKGGEDE